MRTFTVSVISAVVVYTIVMATRVHGVTLPAGKLEEDLCHGYWMVRNPGTGTLGCSGKSRRHLLSKEDEPYVVMPYEQIPIAEANSLCYPENIVWVRDGNYVCMPPQGK